MRVLLTDWESTLLLDASLLHTKTNPPKLLDGTAIIDSNMLSQVIPRLTDVL